MIKNILIILLFSTNYTLAQNHLKNETSPYLLQHKNNPVDWYPWGSEAFNKAKKENKFIFLSIGYSTCHWCHVMAKESFENKKVAKALNKNFISIKVDKEQYPHIDSYFQNIHSLLNKKSGGWPLNIFMTFDKKVFLSTTYLPPHSTINSVGLLDYIDAILKNDKKQLLKIANNVNTIVNLINNKKRQKEPLNKNLINKAVVNLKLVFDEKNGGFYEAPKFPNTDKINFLLFAYKYFNNTNALQLATKSLDAMANGGIYDQIGGGFYRYTIDSKWKTPHYEKMLYTNAQFIKTYTQAYKISKNDLYKKVVIETIDEINKRFEIKDLSLYKSASNADSKNKQNEEEEGYYFLYSLDESIEQLQKHKISKNDINTSLHYLGFYNNDEEEKINPHIMKFKKPKALNKVKQVLKNMRKTRKYPFIDKKINTAWNALYIDALFDASIFDEKYKTQALRSLNSLLKKHFISSSLYHQSIKSKKPTQKALLEDYAFLARCSFNAYQKTLDKKYLDIFKKLTLDMINKFYIIKKNRFQESNDGFLKYADISQNSYTNSLSIAFSNMMILASISEDMKVYNTAIKAISYFYKDINKNPQYYPTALTSAIMNIYKPVILKSTKENIKTIDISQIKYPFIYKLASKNKNYIACQIGRCFSYNSSLKIVKKDIENLSTKVRK